MLFACSFDTSDLAVERVEVKIGGEAAWEGVQVCLASPSLLPPSVRAFVPRTLTPTCTTAVLDRKSTPGDGVRAERSLWPRRRREEHAGWGGKCQGDV